MTFTLILIFFVASIIKAKKILVINDAGITILVGVFTGSLLVLSRKNNENRRFDDQIFFDILLPFIIFESGYNMNKQKMKKHFKVIASLAFFGKRK